VKFWLKKSKKFMKQAQFLSPFGLFSGQKINILHCNHKNV